MGEMSSERRIADDEILKEKTGKRRGAKEKEEAKGRKGGGTR